VKRKLSAAVFFAAAAMLAFAASAHAVDGTIEINQAKVLANGGVFPYTISVAGSYRLTGFLVVPTGKDGIHVTSTHVTIDLNGFSIIGPGSSSGTPYGIFAEATDDTVKNGTIIGFGTGVELSGGSAIRNVHADGNFNGIGVNIGSVVEGCTANNSNNGGTGIQCQARCAITGNTANGDSAGGITCGAPGPGDGCVISGNTVTFDGVGIHCVGSGCLITGNTVSNNTTGIEAADATTGYGGNVLYNNTPNFAGGTSMPPKTTNLCGGLAC